MNKLLEAQKNQVETFRSIRNDFQQDVQLQKARVQDLATSYESMQQDVKEQLGQFSEDIIHKNFIRKAFDNRKNIVIIGLPEHQTHSAYSVAMKFFKSSLNLRRLDVDVAFRLGNPPSEGSSYSRPLIVKFNRMSDRNSVWKLRYEIPQEDGLQTIKIQADLPKQLRDDVNTLYRVLRAASALPEYRSASIRDYMFLLHGKQFTARQLEHLPVPLRPSSLACRISDRAMVFFSKFSPLSNHHPSEFTLYDKTFHTMEQYLAFKRAEFSGNHSLMEKAAQAIDPVEAKSVLNALRQHNIEGWQEQRSTVAMEGLRAKFGQNEHLSVFLKNTKQLLLGEASKNPTWGIGQTLEDKLVLDSTRWNTSGNLLGNLLMQLRSDLNENASSAPQQDGNST